jgi:hypothetical protein
MTPSAWAALGLGVLAALIVGGLTSNTYVGLAAGAWAALMVALVLEAVTR